MLAFTDHASRRMLQRNITAEWIERVAAAPFRVEPDKTDPELSNALLAIPEAGNKVLRVVYNPKTTPWTVITVFFDRAERGAK